MAPKVASNGRGPVHARLGSAGGLGRFANGQNRKRAKERLNGHVKMDQNTFFDARNLIGPRQQVDSPFSTDVYPSHMDVVNGYEGSLPVFDSELAAHAVYQGNGELSLENDHYRDGSHGTIPGPPADVVHSRLSPTFPGKRIHTNDLRHELSKRRRYQDNPHDLRSRLQQMKRSHPPSHPFSPVNGDPDDMQIPFSSPDLLPYPMQPEPLRITIPIMPEEATPIRVAISPPVISAKMRSRLSNHPSRIVQTEQDFTNSATVMSAEQRSGTPRSPLPLEPVEIHRRRHQPSRRSEEEMRRPYSPPVVARHRHPHHSPPPRHRSEHQVTSRPSGSRSSVDRLWQEAVSRLHHDSPRDRSPDRRLRSGVDRHGDLWPRRRSRSRSFSPRPPRRARISRSRSPLNRPRRRNISPRPRYSPVRHRPQTRRSRSRSRSRNAPPPATRHHRRFSTPPPSPPPQTRPLKSSTRRKSPSVDGSFHSGSSYYDNFELDVSGSESPSESERASLINDSFNAEPRDLSRKLSGPHDGHVDQSAQVLNLTTTAGRRESRDGMTRIADIMPVAAPRPLDLSATSRVNPNQSSASGSVNQTAAASTGFTAGLVPSTSRASVSSSGRFQHNRSSLVMVPVSQDAVEESVVQSVVASSPSPAKTFAFKSKSSDRNRSAAADLVIDGRVAQVAPSWTLTPITRVGCDYAQSALNTPTLDDDPRWQLSRPAIAPHQQQELIKEEPSELDATIKREWTL